MISRILIIPGVGHGLLEIHDRPNNITVKCKCCGESVTIFTVAGGIEEKTIAHGDDCLALAFFNAIAAGRRREAVGCLRRAKAMIRLEDR